MKKFGIINTVTSKIRTTYNSKFQKNKPIQENEVQFELKQSNGQYWNHEGAYSWDGSQVVFDPSYVPFDPSSKYCKIYRYVPEDQKHNKTNAPVGHDYITGLTTRLFAKRTLIKGELIKVEWYADEEKTDLVIVVDIVYERDPLGFATRRTTTRTWIREDGTEATPKKVTIKAYSDDMLSQIEEGQRRRGNLVKGIQMPVMGMLIATIPAKSGESEVERQGRIVLLGRKFLSDNKQYFTAFTEDSNREIVEVIEGSTDFWMDNIIDGNGTTIRQYLLNELNIGGVA